MRANVRLLEINSWLQCVWKRWDHQVGSSSATRVTCSASSVGRSFCQVLCRNYYKIWNLEFICFYKHCPDIWTNQNIYFQTQIPPINERLPCLPRTLDRHELATSFFITTVIIAFNLSLIAFTFQVDQFHEAIQNVTHPKLSPSLSSPTDSSSIILKYHQLSSIIIKHHQLSSININHHQLSSIRQSNSDGESRNRSLQIVFKIIYISIYD